MDTQQQQAEHPVLDQLLQPEEEEEQQGNSHSNVDPSQQEYNPAQAVQSNQGGQQSNSGDNAMYDDQANSQDNALNCNIYVGQLSHSVGDQELRTQFSQVGTIEHAKVMYDQHTRKSKGFGFVRFANPTDAANAITQFNGKTVWGRALQVKHSNLNSATHVPKQRENTNGGGGYGNKHYGGGHNNHQQQQQQQGDGSGTPSTNLYVKGLPYSMDDDQIRNLFSPYGTIVHVKLLKDLQTQTSRGQAFVKFDTPKAAEYAITSLNGYTFPGMPKGIMVKYADTPEEKQQRTSSSTGKQMRQPQSLSNSRYNPYPNMNTAAAAAVMNPMAIAQQMGALGMMGNPYAAYAQPIQQAPTGMGRGRGGGQPQASQPFFGGMGIPAVPGVNQMMGGGGGAEQGTILFVSALPKNCDDATLYKLFGPFGRLFDVKIIRDKQTQQSKGYAFITMGSPGEALNAVNNLNGTILEDKKLIVSFKK